MIIYILIFVIINNIMLFTLNEKYCIQFFSEHKTNNHKNKNEARKRI